MESKKVIFLDRDGVINRMIKGEYVLSWDQFAFLPGAQEAIKMLTDAGWDIYVITNQAGIARGLMSEQALIAIHDNMKSVLAEQGASIKGIYYCPHQDTDNCDCRKPKPGLLLRAAKEHDIDLSKTIFIGDRLSDQEAGRAAGCMTMLIEENGDLLGTVKKILTGQI